MTSENDSARRPRPQYGEYATPEQQRARIQQPGPGHPDYVEPAGAGVPPPPAPAVPPASPVTSAPQRPPRVSATGGGNGVASAPTRDSPGDRVATVILLALGAVYVLLAAGSYLDLAAVFDEMYTLMGVPGTFVATSTTHAWGVAAAVVLVVGYVLTVAFSVRRLRRRRRAWWIPIVGAVVTYLAVSACVAVPLMSDPALQAYLTMR